MREKIKYVVLGVLGLMMAVANIGCTEEDVAAGVVVGAIIGATIFDDDDDHHHRRGHHRHGDRDGRWRDGRGHRRDCHWGNDCRRPRRGWHSADSLQQAAGTQAFTNRLKTKFDLPNDSAKFISSLMVATQRGDWMTLRGVGFSESDVKRLSRMRMPSDNGLNKFSQAVNIDFEKSQALFTMVTSEAKAQFANIESEAWEVCLTTTGKWKTPQNLACSGTYQNGCSPSTGATQCVPR